MEKCSNLLVKGHPKGERKDRGNGGEKGGTLLLDSQPDPKADLMTDGGLDRLQVKVELVLAKKDEKKNMRKKSAARTKRNKLRLREKTKQRKKARQRVKANARLAAVHAMVQERERTKAQVAEKVHESVSNSGSSSHGSESTSGQVSVDSSDL